MNLPVILCNHTTRMSVLCSLAMYSVHLLCSSLGFHVPPSCVEILSEIQFLHFSFFCLSQILYIFFFFFLNDPAPPEISPLPLHAPLPISAASLESQMIPFPHNTLVSPCLFLSLFSLFFSF